jgi:polyhydroxyalkanoate synthesis regulator phasin
MDNKELKKYAEETVKSVSSFMDAALKSMENLKEQIAKDPKNVANLSELMKAAEASDKVKELQKQLKDLSNGI